MNNPSQAQPPRARYVWPWFVLAGVLLGVALAVLWVSREVERTRQHRQWNTPALPATNAPSR